MYYTEGGEIGSRLQRNRDNLVVLCSAEELPCGLDLERERCVLACCEGCLELQVADFSLRISSSEEAFVGFVHMRAISTSADYLTPQFCEPYLACPSVRVQRLCMLRVTVGLALILRVKEALEIGLVRGRLGFVCQEGLPRSEWSSPYTYRYTLMVAVLSSGEWLSAGRIKGFNVDWDSSRCHLPKHWQLFSPFH